MPYLHSSGSFERSRSIGHVPIIENELVRDRLSAYCIHNTDASIPVDPSLLTPADRLLRPGPSIDWVFAFDGSLHEVAVREQFPSTRIGYIQVAGVLVNLKEMLRQEAEQLVDPAVIRRTTTESLQSVVLPGSNVCRPDMSSVRDSWRAEIFEIFRTYKVEDRTLLGILELLVGDATITGSNIHLQRCTASPTCEAKELSVPMAGCNCPGCGCLLFPTDTLRVHEEVVEEHANATALGRLMTVLEQITMVAYLDYLRRRKPELLGTVAFILDGPLALFGPQAPLMRSILTFIQELQTELNTRGLRPPLVMGIEKGGQFAEHAQAVLEAIQGGT